MESLPNSVNSQATDNLYHEGVQNVMKSVILYSTTFRKIASDLVELYSGQDTRLFDYTVLFANFYERTNQLIDAISNTMADIIRRSTTQDSVRSKTTNALKREILNDSFYDLNENLQRFKVLMNELGIAIESKTSENAFNTTVLTAGTIGAVLRGTRKMSYIDGMAIASLATQNYQNSVQIDQMRRQKVDAALAAMVTTTSLMEDLTVKLMDQYISLVYGGNVNLDTRDQYLTKQNAEVNIIISICNHVIFSSKEIYKLIINFNKIKIIPPSKPNKKLIILALSLSTLFVVYLCYSVLIQETYLAIFSIFALLLLIVPLIPKEGSPKSLIDHRNLIWNNLQILIRELINDVNKLEEITNKHVNF